MRRNLFSKNNKQGMELSINFIVMLILGIVMFGMGLAVLGKMIGQSEDMSDKLDKETQTRMMNMEMSGKIAIYPETFELKRQKSKVIAVGIKNVGNEANFRVTVSHVGPESSTLEADSFTFIDGNGDINYDEFLNDETHLISKNDRKIVSFPLKIPSEAQRVRHIFAIKAYKDVDGLGTYEQYGSTKMLYIDVD